MWYSHNDLAVFWHDVAEQLPATRHSFRFGGGIHSGFANLLVLLSQSFGRTNRSGMERTVLSLTACCISGSSAKRCLYTPVSLHSHHTSDGQRIWNVLRAAAVVQ